MVTQIMVQNLLLQALHDASIAMWYLARFLRPIDTGLNSGFKRIPYLVLCVIGLVIAFIVCLPYVFFASGPMFTRQDDVSRMLRRRQKEMPEPLLPPPRWYRRKYRAVSLEFDPALQMERSAFFEKLPSEVRIMIYGAALGAAGGLVHLKSIPLFEEYRDPKGRKHVPRKRVSHALCRRVGERYCECFAWQKGTCVDCYPTGEFWGIRRMSRWDGGGTRQPTSKTRKSPSPEFRNGDDRRIGVGLLQACRQMHAEAVPILYGANIFTAYGLWDLLDFSSTVLPDRLAIISNLDIQWRYYDHRTHSMADFHLDLRQKPGPFDDKTWVDVWDVIATRMTGLKVLKASLDVSMYHDHLALNEWLTPMLGVRCLRRCSLQLEGKTPSWHDWRRAGVPFNRTVADILERKLEDHMMGKIDFAEDELYSVVSLDSYEGGLR